MDFVPSGELALSIVTGPAVFGHDPEQVLCWTPCCRQPIRLDPSQFERRLPVPVTCDGRRCQRSWTVEFPELPPWKEQVAVWRAQPRPETAGSADVAR
ncbi:MAG: hypothetical protein ACRDYX_09775 [Egibacteraceae bacterium]